MSEANRQQGLAPGQEKVPPSLGGRGEQPRPEGLISRIFTRRQRSEEEPRQRRVLQAFTVPLDPEGLPDKGALIAVMRALVARILARLVREATDINLLPAIEAVTRVVVEESREELAAVPQAEIMESWLGPYQRIAFGEADAPEVMRQREDQAQEAAERALKEHSWWLMEMDWPKAELLSILAAAYRRGALAQALAMLRTMAEAEGAAAPASAVGLSFEISNPRTISLLERFAAELVRNIDDGTRYYLRRLITAGVREGIASDRIADAIRKGALAEDILRDEDYVRSVLETIRDGLALISEYRAESIVNTEINRAENLARLDELARSGLARKRWVHLGERGVTEAGNVHPCPVCEENEALGWVPTDFLYTTVFGEADALTPPGHPGVCHCTIFFDEDELRSLVAEGAFKLWEGD